MAKNKSIKTAYLMAVGPSRLSAWPCLGSLLLLLPITAFTQDKPYSEKVTVVGQYKPTVQDANKINFSPAINDTVKDKPKFTYSIKSIGIPTTFSPEPLEAAKMAGEPIKKLYENYLKVGLGNYWTPYAELFYNTGRSKGLSYGLRARHLSGHGVIKDYGNPAYSQNGVDVFARRFFDKHSTLNTSLGFDREVVHYYGFRKDDYDTLPSDEDLKQRFSIFHLGTDWKSASTDSSKLGYQLGFSARHIYDLYKTRETSIDLNGQIGMSGAWLPISRSQRWALLGGYTFYHHYSEEGKSNNTSLFRLQPELSTELGALSITAGLNLNFQGDTTTYLRAYPVVKLEAEVIEGDLQFYAGLDGGIHKATYYSLSRENPFVDPNIECGFVNNKYRFFAGMRARLARVIDVHFLASQSNFDHLPFFTNFTEYYPFKTIPFPSVYRNQFDALYLNNVDLFQLKGELAYHPNQYFSLLYNCLLNQYSTGLEWMKTGYAPHKPKLEMSLGAAYNIQNKLILSADLFYTGIVYAHEYNVLSQPFAKELPARYDINLGIEYHYSRLLSAFVKLNNLANQRYFIWNEYPSQRFNFIAGLSFSF